MSAEVLTLINRLDEARQRWWLYTLLCRLAIAGSVIALALALVLVLDQMVPFGPGALLVPAVFLVLLTASVLTAAIVGTIRQHRSLEAAARRVEASFPELDGKLVSLLQLARSNDPFAQAAVRRLVAEVSGRPIEEAAAPLSWRARVRYGLATPRDAAIAGGVFLALCLAVYSLHLLIPGWGSSFRRLLVPWSFSPHVGAVRILEVQPGDATVIQGKPLQITVRVAIPEEVSEPPRGVIVAMLAGGTREKFPLIADGKRTAYTGTIPSVAEDFAYYVQIGTTQSDLFRVSVTTPPEIVGVRLTYRFPQYTGQAEQVIEQPHGNIRGVQYTEVLAEFRSSTPISRGYVETADGTIPGAVTEDGRGLRVRFLLLEDTSYSVLVFNELGVQNPSPQPYRIEVVPDKPPAVRLLAPVPESTVPAGGVLAVAAEATDDYGVERLWCEVKVARPTESDRDPTPYVLREWKPVEGDKSHLRGKFKWDLPENRFPPGTTLFLRALARDNRYVMLPGHIVEPQEAATEWIKVTVVAPEEQAAALLELLSDLRSELGKILRLQLEARLNAAQARQSLSTDAFTAHAGAALRLQRAVRNETGRVIGRYQGSRQSFAQMAVEALQALHNREMAQAERLAEHLGGQQDPSARAATAGELLAVQDKIIDVLNRLLDLSRNLETRALAEAEEKEGGDIPPEPVLDKLRELKEKLDEFLRQQKRVIEASENLAKKPVEDFTDEDEKLLEELAAIEEDWSRFMGETRSDLSKLPEQDFTNPSLLEELVEIETELKMAADALTKKAVEIAVPLEQLGAERAEEMMANIEKWLPDTPDRERWMQEEPLDDMFKSAPMAELPGELEDLVGELMEEEEALFEEMEDISSSWADSLDKGAGWDAMDGPISNMSARGVTGNRLPNNSEIGGRSGEGRQGKAHGEFVSETAVGKGGRKTPTRLTPDPVVEGEIKDTSKDPVGGATGGGKQSGLGGEGLEGPARAHPDVLQRLAEKQATLRNKAEVIDLRLSVSRYQHMDLDDIIARMKDVERDLRTGRIHEALRRREEILGGLNDLKRYVGGDIETRVDRSTTTGAGREETVTQAAVSEAPPGWEELTRKYFEKLGKGR